MEWLETISSQGRLPRVRPDSPHPGLLASLLFHGVLGLLLYSLTSGGPKMAPPVMVDLSLLAITPPAPVEAVAMPPPAVAPPSPAASPVPEARPAPARAVKEARPARARKAAVPQSEQPVATAETASLEPAAAASSPPSAEVAEVAAVAAVAPELPPAAAAAGGGSGAPASTSVPEAPPLSVPPLSAEERWRLEHFAYIQEAIRQHMTYPLLARKNGWQGRVLVSFMIGRDGEVDNIRIEKSSGFSLLDRNAVSIIKEIAPFPNPPVPATLIVPIDFTLG